MGSKLQSQPRGLKMDIFEKIGKKFGLIKEEKSKTEQIMEERNNIKLNLAVKLYKQGFSDDEIETILGIIESAEEDIQKIKDSLIGTNINSTAKDPMQPLIDGRDAIRARQVQMQKEINETIAKFAQNHAK